MTQRTSRPKPDTAAATAVLSLRIQPRASKNEAVRMENGGLKIRLTAPPVEGAANEALIRFLAEMLSVAKSQIEIVSGHASREKIVRIHGVTEDDATRVLYSKGK
jgi:uncharacterized protein (TIGR00251 family)